MGNSTHDVLLVATARWLAAEGRARELRIRAGLSLRDVAAALKTSAANVQRWETGARRPNRDAAHRYGELLAALDGVSTDESSPTGRSGSMKTSGRALDVEV